MKYNIRILIRELNDVTYEEIEIDVEYENEYELKKDIINIGNNGILHNNIYYPSNSIFRIYVKKLLTQE